MIYNDFKINIIIIYLSFVVHVNYNYIY
jgi:hypothetical protein